MHHSSSSPSTSAIGQSSSTGSAGGGSSSTCERSKTGPSLNHVRGLSSGTLPAARQASSCFLLGAIGTQIRIALSPLRTQ